MRRSVAIVAAAMCVVGAAEASAASRVWLSAAKGVDTNPCSLQAPCRTFAGALNKVDPGGEIDFLDPGGYGFADITQAVSIVNDGIGEAGSQGSGGVSAAIFVRAGANDDVVIRGLTIEGARTTANGIDYISGRSLTIQNCVIRNFLNFGVWAENSAPSNLHVISSTISDNFGRGINIATKGTGSLNAVIDRSTVSNNWINIAVDGVNNSGRAANPTKVTISNSTIAFGTDGIDTTAGAQSTNLFLRDNVITNNSNYGVYANNNGSVALVTLAHNAITQNGVGVVNNGAVYSMGDNHILSNATEKTGPEPVILPPS